MTSHLVPVRFTDCSRAWLLASRRHSEDGLLSSLLHNDKHTGEMSQLKKILWTHEVWVNIEPHMRAKTQGQVGIHFQFEGHKLQGIHLKAQCRYFPLGIPSDNSCARYFASCNWITWSSCDFSYQPYGWTLAGVWGMSRQDVLRFAQHLGQAGETCEQGIYVQLTVY